MNVVSIIGNLGADPVIRSTGAGKQVANLRLAYNEGSGDKKQTHWFNVVAWDKDAEFAAKFLKKGSRVGVTGRLTMRSWAPKEGGAERHDVEITASRLDGLDSKEAREGGAASYAGGSAAPRQTHTGEPHWAPTPPAGPIDYRVKEGAGGRLVAAGEAPLDDADLPF